MTAAASRTRDGGSGSAFRGTTSPAPDPGTAPAARRWALSAHRVRGGAVWFRPVPTPQFKTDAVAGRWAEVVLLGDSYSDAYRHAVALQAREHLVFVHPFDDPDVIAGQGTIGMEILRQHTGPLDAIFIAIGGGGLAAGVAAYVKAIRPEVRLIGVQSVDSDAMARSIACLLYPFPSPRDRTRSRMPSSA